MDFGTPMGIGIRLKLILVTGSVILITSLVFGYVSYEQQRDALLEGIDAKLLAAAHLAAAVPPEGHFDRIEDADSVSPDDYDRIVGRNNELCKELGLQYLWSCMLVDTRIVFTTSTSPSHDISQQDHAKFFEVHSDPESFNTVFSKDYIEKGKPDFSSFHNEWGDGRMVLVPARDAHGRPYCFGASMSVSKVHDLLANTLWRSLFLSLVILAGGVVASIFLASTLARPLVRLTTVAAAIARGERPGAEKDAAPIGGLGSTREVTSLASSIAAMRRSIRERIRALRESEEHLRTTLDSITDAVIATDARGKVIGMNPVAEEMTGWPIAEAGETTVTEILRVVEADTREPLANPVESVLVRGEPLNLAANALLVSRSGREYRVAESGAPIVNAAGEAYGVVLVLHDVTERHAVEERLRHSHKMEALGRLAGGVAHDFNNILSGIIGSAEMLRLELENPVEAREHLDLILLATERAGDLVTQLVDFARKGKTESIPVDIHEVIGAAVALLRRSVDKRIMVRMELTASSTAMIGDPAQLQSAFLNLGLNARDAMPDGGTITIRTEDVELPPDYCSSSPFRIEHGKHLYVEVRDTGTGMDREVLERIFDPFFTTKEVGKGTGLGLAAVYGVVKDHHGAIEAQSWKNEGTVFHIYLPVKESLTTPQPETDGELEHGSGCILVVDDEELVRTTVQGMLEHLGYEVLTAVDGQDGVEVYQQNHDRIDLVLLDAVMPRMRGRECLHTLKVIDPDVKVIVVSGFAQDDQAVDFVRDGALAFVMKPLNRDTLGSIIARAMRGERVI